MNTTEHLAKIKAYCLRNLEIAAKRTPGEWHVIQGKYSNAVGGDFQVPVKPGRPQPREVLICQFGLYSDDEANHKGDAEFTAICAGAAEAGWKATIAAIDSATALCHVDLSPCNGGSCMVATTADEEAEGIRSTLIHAILAAYPLELISL